MSIRPTMMTSRQRNRTVSPNVTIRRFRVWFRDAWFLVLFTTLAAFGAVRQAEAAASTELKARYPQECGSTLARRLGAIDEITDKAAPGAALAADVDVNHIAVLEDTGTLVVFDNPSQTWITNTSAIQSRYFGSHAAGPTYLCIFTASTFAQDVQPEGGFAFEQNMSNNVQGINLIIFNIGQTLRSRLNMNDLGEYGLDPSEELPGFLGTFSGVDVLGQEAAHMVGAFVQADNADILGRSDAHWSFFLETYGSVNEGNGWTNISGNDWRTTDSGTGYSQLDNYLYGLLHPDDFTDPMYVLNSPVPNLVATQNGDATTPAVGVNVRSTSQTTVTVQNVINQNGARVPDANSAPHSFIMQFILVVPQGTTIAAHDMEKIDDFRVQWQEFFSVETAGVGTMVTEVTSVPITVDFESREQAGEVGTTVHFDNDSFGSITGYLWDFGDGNTSTERHPTHTYGTAGSFDVALTISGDGGPTTLTKTDFIRIGPTTSYFLDAFESDQGWTLDEVSTTGNWTRADPLETIIGATFGNDFVSINVQPSDDHTSTGVSCLVTGNNASGTVHPDSLGRNDVDGGPTSIVSPVLDLSTAIDPVLSVWSYYSNNAGASPGRDAFEVQLRDSGSDPWVTARSVLSSYHYWREDQVRILDHIALTESVQVRIRTMDSGDGSLVECAVDDIRIFDVDASVDVAEDQGDTLDGASLAGFALDRNRPNPFASETSIRYAVPAPGALVSLRVYSVDGRLVRTVVDGWSAPGIHSASWEGFTDAGVRAARGMYVFRLQTPQGALSRKVFYAK